MIDEIEASSSPHDGDYLPVAGRRRLLLLEAACENAVTDTTPSSTATTKKLPADAIILLVLQPN